ncbi:MAG: hypothetical protein IPO21_16655 [Bacteroidales bacterium]|nr:hypothetical protein [Bacteroidales bacterium]
MKTKDETKEFHAVEYMREMRDKISLEIADLSKEQILQYFKTNRPKDRIIPFA